ncbi:DUF2027 domain-containing protein [uncultured Proteiniphilum sp.]|uniref:DUF2027 domain-containing protein n=1 Tax=uncultured Proteiniphilum sp. TaxID=497637 RepID=UPI00261720E3|nr:DUF2027 domain-containing protein [uncultured Proteiniphilum sp.]
MNKLSTGDTVRFLNTVGGGIVKGFRNKQVVIVEDEHGFDVPVLISECVVVKPAGNEKLTQLAEEKDVSFDIASLASTLHATAGEEERKEQPEETPEGEKITACLAWLPLDIKNLSSTAYECYFVNDSNYYLFFNYMNKEGDSLKIRYSGLIEPNTKIFLEELEKSDLNDIEKVIVQFIAFKRHKPFNLKNPCSVELRIDTVKFYKLHSFGENDYFEDNALIRFIIQNDTPENELHVSAGDLEHAMKEKKRQDGRSQGEPVEKKRKETVTEIDLHINELLDTTAGMSNADILEYQLNKFNEVMNEHIHRKNHKIVFIHGRGDGVLRNAILKELKKNYPKCFYQDASFSEYGYGATMVTVK